MPQGITVNTLRSWKTDPPSNPVYVSDADSPLRVRRNTDGSLAFCVRRRRLGKRERRTLGQWPDLGLAEARKLARQWANGTEIKTRTEEREGQVTLGEVLDAYFDEIRLHAKTWRDRRALVRRFVPRDLLQRPAASIGRGEIRSWLLGQVAESGHRANKLHKIFSAAFNRAVDAECLDRNPLAGLKRPFKEKPRKNILDFEKLRRIWLACEDSADERAKAIQLLMLTGCRLREILWAKWSAVDAQRWLTIHDNKSDRPHKVFLSDLAWSVVESLSSREVSPYLFPKTGDLGRPVHYVQPTKEAISEIAEAGEWRLHDLRATFLSHSIAQCSTLPVVAKVCVNHSLPGVTDTNYVERAAYYSACREAWMAYSALVEEIVSGTASTSEDWQSSFRQPVRVLVTLEAGELDAITALWPGLSQPEALRRAVCRLAEIESSRRALGAA